MKRRIAVLFAVALTVVVAACSGSDDVPTAERSMPASTPSNLQTVLPSIRAGLGLGDPVTITPSQVVTVSAGRSPVPLASIAAEATRIARCDDQDNGDRTETLRSGDLDRSYILHIPPQYDGARRLPVVLNLHGYGSNARNQAAYSRLPAKADEAGFIVVTPDGAGTPQQWNNQQLASGADDVGFIRDLLDHLEATLCIDPARIYAAGISNGAAFAQRLACALPDRIAGVAAIAAFVYPLNCGSDRPVPVIAFHGTADACVPYEGGVTTCGRGNLPVPPVETSAENWARHNGCDLDPARSQATASVRVIAYSECDDEVAVLLYAVEGGGHTWPGSIDVPRLGGVTKEIDATELLWDFFEAQAP